MIMIEDADMCYIDIPQLYIYASLGYMHYVIGKLCLFVSPTCLASYTVVFPTTSSAYDCPTCHLRHRLACVAG